MVVKRGVCVSVILLTGDRESREREHAYVAAVQQRTAPSGHCRDTARARIVLRGWDDRLTSYLGHCDFRESRNGWRSAGAACSR